MWGVDNYFADLAHCIHLDTTKPSRLVSISLNRIIPAPHLKGFHFQAVLPGMPSLRGSVEREADFGWAPNQNKCRPDASELHPLCSNQRTDTPRRELQYSRRKFLRKAKRAKVPTSPRLGTRKGSPRPLNYHSRPGSGSVLTLSRSHAQISIPPPNSMQENRN